MRPWGMRDGDPHPDTVSPGVPGSLVGNTR
jgi:hypothetical protein